MTNPPKNDTPRKPSPATPSSDGEKFIVPPEWRVRCDIRHLTAQTKTEYAPLNDDLIRCLLDAQSITFVIFFVVGWDIYEFIRPSNFDVELVKEMIDIRKKWPSQTRVAVLKNDYFRFEQMASAFRKRRFEAASGGAAMALTPLFNGYAALSDASQEVVRGGLTLDVYARVAAGASYAVTHMASTKDVLSFMTSIIGKDPVLYDHGAVTAFVAITIAWNSLGLTKRESKLCGQAGIMHDVERNCAHLFKPAVTNRVSEGAIKELNTLQAAHGTGFHERVLQTMGQYREKFAGGGFPGLRYGASEERGDQGIDHTARIVAVACAFSEYLLKRQDKQPLPLTAIMSLIERRAGSDFDPEITAKFIANANSDEIRKSAVRKESDDQDFADEYDGQ